MQVTRLYTTLLVFFVVSATADSLEAQSVTHVPLYTISNVREVSGAGDVDGDGVNDFIIGDLLDDTNGETSGSARVFSGSDGSLLYTFYGDNEGDEFGYSVSGAGDVNGDGKADLIVGAQRDDNNGEDSGSARVFSGSDGSVLYTFNGDSEKDRFGWSVSGAGDVNGDGKADLIVGAPFDSKNASFGGSARVFSGSDGSVLYTFDGESERDQLGSAVSDAGDVNGDGMADLLVGVQYDDINGENSGGARVYSGNDGSVLYNFEGVGQSDNFGYAVSNAGDVNEDGIDDFIIGMQSTRSNDGYAQVLSGSNGSVLHAFNGDDGSDRFGIEVSGAGDVNGDGVDDLIVGAPFDDDNGSNSGSARVFSGSDGSVLYNFYGDRGDFFGWSASGVGDINEDGIDDFIIEPSAGNHQSSILHLILEQKDDRPDKHRLA